MAIHKLGSGAECVVRGGNVELMLQVSGGDPTSVLVDAVGDRDAQLSVEKLSDTRYVLFNSGAKEVSLIAKPVGSRLFPGDLRVGVTLHIRGERSDAGDQVVCAPQDVAGLEEAGLVSLRYGSPPNLTICTDALRSAPPAEAELPPVARAARYAGRAMVGGSAGGSLKPLRLVVELDTSASMYVRRESVEALLLVIVGVNEVFGGGQTPFVFDTSGLAAASVSLDAGSCGQLFGDSQQRRIGASFAPAAMRAVELARQSGEATMLVVITDDLPADLEALAATLESSRAAGAKLSCVLLLLTDEPGLFVPADASPDVDLLRIARVNASGLNGEESVDGLIDEAGFGQLVSALTQTRQDESGTSSSVSAG